jgi:hypothetical protein
MTPQKPVATAPKAPTPASSANTPAGNTERKPWIKKSPVAIVLEQIGKQEKIVSAMRADLAREERELTKLQKAKAVLEA